MSLQLAAQHLAAQGRGPDKQLVHMSPREVAGLQALAMAHGGSLSINPETGLPEAGFLDSLLPTIIGAGLAFATGGTSLALSPAMIGLGVGGIQALRTGDLSKGLMAGLGAYGGAGLFSSLAGPGMAVTNPQAAQIATAQTAQAAPIVDVTGAATAAEQSAIQNALISPEYQYIAPPTEYANPFTGQAIGADYAYGPQVQADLARQAQYGERVASLVKDNVNFDPQLSENLRQMQKLGGPESARAIMGEFPPPLTSAESIVPSVGTPISPEEHLQAMSKLTGAPPSNSVDFLSGMSDVSAVEGPGVAGAGLPTRSSTFASRLAAMPTKDLAKYGLAAAAPVLLAPPEYEKPELDSEQYRYAYSPGPVMPPTRSGDVGEYTYFRPSYTRLAEGGSTDGYRYEYDPVRQAYKQSLPPKTSEGGKEKTTSGDTRGDSGGGAFSPGAPGSLNPADTIAFGQALQGYGQLGFAPGAMMAGLIGDAVVNSGVNQLGAMEGLAGLSASQGYGLSDPSVGQGEVDARSYAEHSASTAAPEAGPSSGYSADASSGWGTDYAAGGITALAYGGQSHLGDYSDGGRLLRGPGDGVSDSIPATIGDKRPARLADGEFVVPARIVSELGNGSTDAGARKLYAMMDRIQSARGKTTGKGKVAKNTRSEKYLPA